MSFWTTQANVITIGDNTGTAYSAANPLPNRAFDGAATAIGTQANPLVNNPQVPAAANILAGYRSDTVSTAAATLITIPAGRTWQGVLSVSATANQAAAGTAAPVAEGTFSILGAGATPPAGNLFSVRARNGANSATGTVGTGAANANSEIVTIIAPGGNSVAIQAASAVGGGTAIVDFSAVGVLIA